MNTEIGTPGLDTSKKGSNKNNPKQSIQSYKGGSLQSHKKSSQESIQNIQVIPLRGSPESVEESPKEQLAPSNDVSDIYRVINSDIQYRKSKKQSKTEAKKVKEAEAPKLTIENVNLEKNKHEYMKKIETKISKNKFQNNLKMLDFTDDLEKDDDMVKMKEHAKKLQAIRMQKQASGVNSAKEMSKGSQRHAEHEEKKDPEKVIVQVENVKINLETLGVDPMGSNSNTRPLSMENDFIPELMDSKGSKQAQTGKDLEMSKQNEFQGDYSNTDYEKRNNGSFDQSYEPFKETKSGEDLVNPKKGAKTEESRQKKEFSENSQRNEMLTYGANSSKR